MGQVIAIVFISCSICVVFLLLFLYIVSHQSIAFKGGWIQYVAQAPQAGPLLVNCLTTYFHFNPKMESDDTLELFLGNSRYCDNKPFH